MRSCEEETTAIENVAVRRIRRAYRKEASGVAPGAYAVAPKALVRQQTHSALNFRKQGADGDTMFHHDQPELFPEVRLYGQ